MKVAIIGTVGVPANYGGFETLVENMLTYKQRKDVKYTIYCTSKAYKEHAKTYKEAKLVYLPIDAHGVQAMAYDSLSIIHSIRKNDILLLLGCSGSWILPILKIFFKKKIILNIDGMDNKREKFSSLKQKVLGKVRYIGAKQADTIIADNQGIKDAVKELYNRDSVLIEYGGDQAIPIADDGTLTSKYGLTVGSYCFKVARIEPENNIEMILEAFSQMPDKKLVIVGNWNRSEFGKQMKEKYSNYPNLILLDPIYEPKALNMLRSNCGLYIHGHSVGGTNPSLVEAMSLGLPIVSYDVVFNRATTEDKCMYFNSVESLKDTVSNLSEAEIERIAKDMKEVAQRRYTWKTIVSKYENLFK
ncbi:MAG: DUF1972 domain-containing protein [Bacteroidales bacterium]|nr:DUF1972 domain-containing protein [Bacteroidales bacterium]